MSAGLRSRKPKDNEEHVLKEREIWDAIREEHYEGLSLSLPMFCYLSPLSRRTTPSVSPQAIHPHA